MIKSISNNYFSLMEISRLDGVKVLRVKFGDNLGDIHIRKFGLADLCLPDVWIVSDKDILDIFQGKYMPYLCVFFRDLEDFCFINSVKLPLRDIDLRDIGKCDLEGRTYDELISIICY